MLSRFARRSAHAFLQTVDFVRAARMAAFSLILTPLSHEWYGLLERLFRNVPPGRFSNLCKLLLDQALFGPFVTALFFVVLGALEGKRLREIRKKLKVAWWPTQKMSWRVWPLAQLINFNYVPPQYRVLAGNLVGFFWGIYMSHKAAN